MEDWVQKNNEYILERFGELLSPYGFCRTKKTFFVRVVGDIAEFIHIHKFTFGPYFRLHFGNRELMSQKESVALNGPDSDYIKNWFYLLVPKRKYSFRYSKEFESIDTCAYAMLKCFLREGEKWFLGNRKINSCHDAIKASDVTINLLRLDKIKEEIK